QTPITVTLEQLLTPGGEDWQVLTQVVALHNATLELTATLINANTIRIVYRGNLEEPFINRFSIVDLEYILEDEVAGTYMAAYCNEDEVYDKDYRFGYNGVEKTNEVAGIGNHYEFKFREYDPRIG